MSALGRRRLAEELKKAAWDRGAAVVRKQERGGLADGTHFRSAKAPKPGCWTLLTGEMDASMQVFWVLEAAPDPDAEVFQAYVTVVRTRGSVSHSTVRLQFSCHQILF